MSKERLFLMISDKKVTGYTWSAGLFAEGHSFNQNLEGIQGFAEFIKDLPQGEDYLLVDLTEEEFRVETIPQLRGNNRQEMIKRQLDRLFRQSVYRRANSQGLNKQKKQESILFSCLMDTTLVSPWLDVLVERNRRVVGLWSLPLLCRAVLRQLSRTTDQALLVSRNSGGLRLTFFSRGRTTVSRLAPVLLDTPEGILAEMRVQIEKTRGYLNSLRLLDQDLPLDVFLLDHGPLWPYLAKACVEIDNLGGGNLYHSQPVDGKELGQALGLTHDSAQTASLDLLFGQMLFKDRPANHYARPHELRLHHTLLARLWIKRATLLLPLLGLLVGAVPFMQGLALRDDLPALTNAISHARQQLQQVEEESISSPLSGEVLEEVAGLHQALEKERMTPQPLLMVIGQALSHHDRLRLETMAWKSSNQANAAMSDTRTSGNTAKGDDQDEQKALFQIAVLEGQVIPFYGNFRDAIDQIERFLTEVRRDPRVHQTETKAIVLPIDLSSAGGAISSAGGGGGDASKVARFQLRIVMGVDHGDD